VLLAFIPVRGGSKSIPLKNIKPFCGRPLVLWYIEALEKCSGVDKIVVATDSDEIERTIREKNFLKTEIFRRSAQNASDTSSTESVMLEYLQQPHSPRKGHMMLCQATSPYVQTDQLQSAIEQYKRSGKDSMLSCSEQKKFYWSPDGKPLNYDPLKRPRRQDFNGTLVENGAFYISTIEQVLSSGCRISGNVDVFMLPEYFLFEIDEPSDWIIAEALMEKEVLKHG
jgi:N-acylneuraminate cytidylyltransferase